MSQALAEDLTRWPLKIAIMKSGYTQARIALAIGRDPAWLSKVIGGYLNPSQADQAKIAKLLKVSQDDLFGQVA